MADTSRSSLDSGRGITVVTSDRAEGLIERLAGDLGADPLSPFDDEIVVVQSLGMRRWLRHELARRHGCAASIDFPFPAAFCHWLAGSRIPGQRAIDPRFDRDALTWRILELFELGVAAEPAFGPLRRFLSDGDARKCLGLAARVAGRFDDYQLYRPETLIEWESGVDDGLANAHERWQAELWRRLCVGNEPPRHLARWFGDAIRRLESVDGLSGLPLRISVFGISTLPPLFVRLLRAAARVVPVRFYVLAPPASNAASGNPLFAAFGGAVRELLDLVGEGAAREEIHDQNLITRPTLLAQLQRDVRAGVGRGLEAGLEAPIPLRAGDDSLTVHVCHSPMREMEVLRDQLLAAFAADASLRPHDILLLVPDIALYAPFVDAVFGVGEPELPRIPHHVADRALVHESAIAKAAISILRLVGARWTATQVVELLDVPSVRRAAGLRVGAGEQVLQWLRDTRIRWGRDGAMRHDLFDLPGVESNSWSAGLDRLIMGYAAGSGDQLFAGVLPFAGATMGDPETLGAFTQWVARLFDLLDDCRRPRPLAEWGRDLQVALSALLAPDDEGESEAFERLLTVLESLEVPGSAGLANRAVDIALVRDWLERALADDSVASGFLHGGMTICALKPMRSIPFRVIAIAGLDDAAFPRRNRRAAYDLLEIDPRRNDRNLRADDRQLFLDTLLSARDRLIVSYVGRSAKNNAVRASSVVIAELLDQIDRGFTGAGRARDTIVTGHRLQPFSAAYYAGDAAGKYFSFSRANARATAIAVSNRTSPAAFVVASGSLSMNHGELRVTLGELIDCWTNPSRMYLRNTLGVHLPADEEPLDDAEPMTVVGLDKYAIDERTLRIHLAGRRSLDRERELSLAAGLLPSGALAGYWVDRLNDELSTLLDQVGRPEFVDPVSIELRGDGWTVTGRVDGMVAGGRVQVRAAKRRAKDLVRAWIIHVALSAAGASPVTRVIGRDGESVFDAIESPMSILGSLVAGYRSACVAPLPVFEQASRDFVDRVMKADDPAARKGGKPTSKLPIDFARDKFIGSEWLRGDGVDPHHALCWRGRDPFAESRTEFEKWSDVLWRPALSVMRDIKLGEQ